MFENSELLSTELQEISHVSAFLPVKIFKEYVEVAKKNPISNVVTWKKIYFSDMNKIIKELKQKITAATNKYLFYYAYNKILCNISAYEYFNDEVLLDFGNSHLFGIIDSKQLVSKLDDELLSKAYYDFFCAPLLNENAVYDIDLLPLSIKKNFQHEATAHAINNEISICKLEENKAVFEERRNHLLSNVELMKEKNYILLIYSCSVTIDVRLLYIVKKQ